LKTLPKILTGFLVIGVVASSALLISNAFFSDTETSTANTFQAGTLDLLIDNTSYYNEVLNNDTSWKEDNLPGHLFFNFTDVKPGDRGEDTISLHVQNNAWVCMDIKITKNDDSTCTDPEKTDDPDCNEPNDVLTDGELAQNLQFVFWSDDGDNVFKTGESIIKEGTADVLFDGATWTLTDSASSIWPTPGPLPGNETRYIGKYWCLGDLQKVPTAPSGFTCNGQNLNNATQTDVALVDINFTAIQARHNDKYLCTLPTPPPQTATTLVINEVLPDSSCKQGQTEAQWLEIYNGYAIPVNLKNFKITDGTNTIDLVNANNIIVSPGGLVLLAHSTSIFGDGKCYPDNGVQVGNLGGQLYIDTGLLKLLDQNNIIIDRVEWGSSPLNPVQNESIEREPLGRDTAPADTFNTGDFIVNNPPTPGL
jgi:predicted ribosomally synthesized peptide with SipW-like signal peptide